MEVEGEVRRAKAGRSLARMVLSRVGLAGIALDWNAGKNMTCMTLKREVQLCPAS